MTRRTLSALVALLALPLAAAGQQWRSGRPSGGPVTVIARAQSDPSVWYVAADDGIYRSGDDGATWSRVSSQLNDVAFLVIDPRDAKRVYVARRPSSPPPHVYRTTDGGITWVALSNGLPDPTDPGRFDPRFLPTGLAIDPVNADTVYVSSTCNESVGCAGAGLFRSINGGDDWARLPHVRWVSHFSVDPASPTTLYVSDFVLGDVQTQDGGATWTKLPLVPSRVVKRDPFDPARRYGVGRVSRLLISADAGRTWEHGEVRLLTGGTPRNWLRGVLDIDPKTGRLFLGTSNRFAGFGGVAAVGGGLFRSGDAGATWLPIEGVGREPVHDLVFDEISGALTIATPTGVYRSGGFPWNEWTELEIGHATRFINSVGAHPRESATRYAVSFNRLFESLDLGASWHPAAEPLPLVGNESPVGGVIVDAAGDVYVVAYAGEYRLFKRSAGSTGWAALQTPRLLGPTVADPNTPGTLYVALSGAIGVTRDGGATWTSLTAPDTPRSLTIDPSNSSRLFMSALRALYRSEDGGSTWQSVGPSLIIVVSNIAISRADPRITTVLARIDHSTRVVLRSTDGGDTWVVIHPVTSDGTALDFWSGDSLVADPRDARILYARTSTNVFRSFDGGATWHALTRGLPPPPYTSIAIDAAGRALQVGSAYGVWTLPLAGRPRTVRTR